MHVGSLARKRQDLARKTSTLTMVCLEGNACLVNILLTKKLFLVMVQKL